MTIPTLNFCGLQRGSGNASPIGIPGRRRGAINCFYVLIVVSLVILAGLFVLLARMGPRAPDASSERLFLFCAAGLRAPVEKIAADYQREYGVSVQLQYGGSGTLLNQLQVGEGGDLYLAADDGYAELAHEKGVVEERLPVAVMRPVVAVRQGNPKSIRRLDDLLRDGVRVALGNPDQAAIGRQTRRLLQDSGHWEALEGHVRRHGVFKPTVPEVANDVKLGSVDAAIVWDSTVAQYPELEAVRTAELDRGAARITLGVLGRSKQPTAALRFARYLTARDRGLAVFGSMGYETVDGDLWAEVPELTFFAGSVNRRALEPIIAKFEKREGVVVNTVYNGCGILTAQMRVLDENRQSGFPDVYMACDVYYLDTVREMFQDAVNVSNTDIVIAVQKGNPKGIRGLGDLVRPGIRVAIGQPDQCTIGVLTRRLLEAEGLFDRLVRQNVVTQTATSALLVPNVTTGSADAALAYVTDTLAERHRLDVVPVDAPLARAVQPFSIARSSDYKHLGRRLFQTISQSRAMFESAGFRWQLDGATPGKSAGQTVLNAPRDEHAKPIPSDAD